MDGGIGGGSECRQDNRRRALNSRDMMALIKSVARGLKRRKI